MMGHERVGARLSPRTSLVNLEVCTSSPLEVTEGGVPKIDMKQGTKKSDHPFSSLSFGQEISIPFVLIFFLYKMRAFHMTSLMIDPMIYDLYSGCGFFFLSSSKV